MLRSHDSLTVLLAEISKESRAEALTSGDSELMRLLLLDSMGCALMSGTRTPLSAVVNALSSSDPGQHRVWGAPATSSMRTAVMLSAALVHGFEFDDQCLGAGLHAGAATVPTALALARGRNLSGEALLVALKSGVEVGIALGRILSGGPGRRGFHIHCWTGALASAATAAAVLRLTTEQTMNAFGIAAAVTGGFISAQYGTEVKRIQAGRAAEAGVLGATLAAAGVEGIPCVVERADGGIASSIAGMTPGEVADTAASLDTRQRWADRVVAFKSVPCKIGIQSPYAALDALLFSTGSSVADVERIRVVAPEHLLYRVGHEYVSGDVQSAQASLRWVLAKRMMSGPLDTRSFDQSALDDPGTVRFANSRIDLVPESRVSPEQEISAWTAEVSIVTTRGEVLASPKDQPTPWFPGNHDAAGIKAKFLRQSATALAPDDASVLMEAIWDIEQEADAFATLDTAITN